MATIPTLATGPNSRGAGYTTFRTNLATDPFGGGTSGVTPPNGGRLGTGIKILTTGLDLYERYKRARAGGGTTTTAGGGFAPTTCPDGFELNPANGVCEFSGSPGDTSTDPGGGGPAGIGALGLFRQPNVVGEIQGRPILRCPTGLVLAVDGMCYLKSALPRQFRKWKPTPKAKISAFDWRMMGKYGPGGSKQNAAAAFARRAGFAVSFTPKGKPKGKRKRK